jgi:hypothetical protein
MDPAKDFHRELDPTPGIREQRAWAGIEADIDQ